VPLIRLYLHIVSDRSAQIAVTSEN